MTRLIVVISGLFHTACASPVLKWRTEVGCHRWGPGCWLPGFAGTDSSPTAGPDGQIVIASYDDHLYSVNPATGVVRWKVKGAGGESSPFVTSQNHVLIASYSSLQCFDGASGKPLWSWKIPGGGSVGSAGAIDESLGLVFVGGLDENMYAVNIANGTLYWKYHAGGEIWSSLGSAKVKSMVCFGVGGSVLPFKDCKAAVHCVERSSGKHVWTGRTGIQIQDRPAYGPSSNQLYVGDYDGCLYAFDADTGVLKWKSECTAGRLESSPSVFVTGNGTEVILIGSGDGYVYAFASGTGKVAWRAKCGIPLAQFWSAGGVFSTVRIVADGHGGGIAYSGGHGLTAIDILTGNIQWHFDASPEAEFGSSPYVSADGSLLVAGGEDGWLYGFDLAGVTEPLSSNVDKQNTDEPSILVSNGGMYTEHLSNLVFHLALALSISTM